MKAKRTVGVIEAEIDGDRILLEPGSLTYYSLNQMGAQIWDRIGHQTADIGAMCGELATEFAVDPGTCTADVHDFLAAAEKAALVELESR